jgi:heme/copper-type cytochrome/quinol oxidase subunit 1
MLADLAMLMGRAEGAGVDLLNAETYNQVMTNHGSLMIFLDLPVVAGSATT